MNDNKTFSMDDYFSIEYDDILNINTYEQKEKIYVTYNKKEKEYLWDRDFVDEFSVVLFSNFILTLIFSHCIITVEKFTKYINFDEIVEVGVKPKKDCTESEE